MHRCEFLLLQLLLFPIEYMLVVHGTALYLCKIAQMEYSSGQHLDVHAIVHSKAQSKRVTKIDKILRLHADVDLSIFFALRIIYI